MIDLRSDTVTKPSPAMRKAIAEAEVGDDVYKEDPTVNRLQEYAAVLLGKEAALFVLSGVMGNQISIRYHCKPGDEVVCEGDAHIFHYESGSPAALSGVSLNPVKAPHGILTPSLVEANLRPPEAYYMPRSKLLAIENTHNRAGGTVYSKSEIYELEQCARTHGLSFHLDGARIWNAAVALGVPVSELAAPFDTVSCCLSKGLGAPVGSIVAGSKEFISEAFRIRKSLGGGTRQAGILAAAGLFALENNIERLAEDHAHARKFAEALDASPDFSLDLATVQTNIISFKPASKPVQTVLEFCKSEGVFLSSIGGGMIRAVTHLDISSSDIDKAISVLLKSVSL